MARFIARGAVVVLALAGWIAGPTAAAATHIEDKCLRRLGQRHAGAVPA